MLFIIVFGALLTIVSFMIYIALKLIFNTLFVKNKNASALKKHLKNVKKNIEEKRKEEKKLQPASNLLSEPYFRRLLYCFDSLSPHTRQILKGRLISLGYTEEDIMKYLFILEGLEEGKEHIEKIREDFNNGITDPDFLT